VFEHRNSPAPAVGFSRLENPADLEGILRCVENLPPPVLMVMLVVLVADHTLKVLLANPGAEFAREIAEIAKMAVVAVADLVVEAGNAVTGLDNAVPIPNLHWVDFHHPYQRIP